MGKKIVEVDNTRRTDINDITRELHTHVSEIGRQLVSILEDLKTYGNNINAIKKVRHLKDMFTITHNDMDKLFKLAEDVGLRKNTKK